MGFGGKTTLAIVENWMVQDLLLMKRDVHEEQEENIDDDNERNALDFANMSSSSSTLLENGNNFNLEMKKRVNRNITQNSVFFVQTAQVQIPLYSIIFLLAIIGNALVILTLVQNKRMRTITNVHLLNLAISDLLLGVFCMPVTLIGTLLKNFIFGGIMCKLIPYLQGKAFDRFMLAKFHFIIEVLLLFFYD